MISRAKLRNAKKVQNYIKEKPSSARLRASGLHPVDSCPRLLTWCRLPNRRMAETGFLGVSSFFGVFSNFPVRWYKNARKKTPFKKQNQWNNKKESRLLLSWASGFGPRPRWQLSQAADGMRVTESKDGEDGIFRGFKLLFSLFYIFVCNEKYDKTRKENSEKEKNKNKWKSHK